MKPEFTSKAHLSSRDLADIAWSEVANLLDLQLSPLGLAAMDVLAPLPGQTIVDIGCGAGQTLLQLASKVGSSGRVIGVDIAPRVLEVARSRTADLEQVELIKADAATLVLPERSVDGIFSRFGVMALDDPIPAFANFRRSTRHKGRLAFVCWRSLDENELDHFPLRAAGLDIPIDTTPFNFASRDYVEGVLRSAGFTAIEIEAFDAEVSSGGVDEMLTVLIRVGPLGRLLREQPTLVASVEPKLRAALIAKSNGGHISLPAATWIVSAFA